MDAVIIPALPASPVRPPRATHPPVRARPITALPCALAPSVRRIPRRHQPQGQAPGLSLWSMSKMNTKKRRSEDRRFCFVRGLPHTDLGLQIGQKVAIFVASRWG